MLKDNFNKNWQALLDIESILPQVRQQIQSNHHLPNKTLEYQKIERSLNQLQQHATVNLFAIMIESEKKYIGLKKKKKAPF